MQHQAEPGSARPIGLLKERDMLSLCTVYVYLENAYM